MASESHMSICGNLAADPELRTTGTGAYVVNLTICSTPRTFDKSTGEWKDGSTLFMRVNLWRDLAEHASHSVRKGDRVIAIGRVVQRSYDTRDGESRVSFEMECEEFGPSLTYATATVQRISKQDNRTQRTDDF